MKVVINDCYGGFSLSEKGVLRLAELKGIKVHVTKDRFGLPEYLTVPPEKVTPELKNWSEATIEQRQAANEAYKREHFSDRDIDRSDPDLVQIVEELGEDASGSHADLKVVEIPDGVDWQIEEYDGNEWVAEKHRKWS